MSFECEKKIFDIHSAFVNEYSQATVGLSEFYGAVTSFFSSVAYDVEEQPTDRVEENIRSIQEICFFLKTFCSEIELHTQLLKTKIKRVTTDPDVIEELVDNVDLEYKPPKNPNEIFPFEVYPEIFTYKTIDPSKFSVGSKDEFFVSYIKDDTSFLFFMMKASCSDIVIQKPEFRYDIIPSKGTVFGLLLDGVIFRAVRENSLPTRPKSFRVYLIDFGEIVEITKDYKMYRLTEDMQQNPGQSIFCKLSENDDEALDDVDYLRNKLFTKQIIRIDRVYKNMLEVTFLPPSTKTVAPTTSKNVASATLSPPPWSKNDASATLSQPSTSKNVASTTLTAPSSSKNVVSTTLTAPSSSKNVASTTLTQEELDELYEEPLNTENAMVAVMGYNPQDDKRICRFTDPKTNACFKGSHCKLEHTTILKDGWTKDQRIFKYTIHGQTPMPRVGKKIQLFIQYVDDIDKFYGHIVPKYCADADDLPAEHIFQKLNDPEMTSKFKKFAIPPAEFELVFALFDGDWYRAKIIQKISEVQYRVFFVDYGNCQTNHINDLRRWEEAFDCYSFQAIECKLDNIIKLKKKDARAIALFEGLVFRKSVTATVTSNAGILLVTINHQDFDVGEQLCAAQFAIPKPITRFPNGTFPG